MPAPPTGDADLQAAFAATLVDEWARCGVAHAVVCPGSRSTPLTLALAVRPGMEVHVRLDERSAGFTALGIGLGSGHPAVVVTTSGTAAAELHPAVVEADLSGVPLLVCTADRPPELRDVGAPQTIDQAHLFGRSPRWFADPGVPEGASRPSWRSLAARAVAEATAHPRGPGPVHLNLPFREPLLGDPGRGGGVDGGRPGGRPWHAVAPGVVAPTEGVVSHLADSAGIHPGARGLIVAGAGCGSPAAVLALSRALRWPVLADPRSGVRLDEPGVIGAADGILRSGRFASAHVPECIIRLGERWASKVVNGFVSAAEPGGTSVVVDPYGRWSDPERTTSTFVRSDPTSFCLDLAGHVLDRHPHRAAVAGGGRATPPGDADWWDGWCRAEARAWTAITAELSGGTEPAGDDGPLTEPALAHRLFSRMPSEATLTVSSSMPVRDVEAFAAPRGRPPRVLSNRGANGIDGVVSTALGVAIGAPGPVVVLVGDLAFLHDVSALVGSEGSEIPLTVVVADNGGGGIFSFLEPASALDPATFDQLFGTPQGPDIAAVAAGFGWPVDDVDGGADPVGFEEALDRRLAGGGSSVIRVRLPGRSENVAVHGRLHAAIVEAVNLDGSAAQQGRGS